MQLTHYDNGRQITVYHNDSILTFNREENEKLFLQVRELYKVADYEAISKLVLTAEDINFKYADSELSISKDGVVTINKEVLPSSLSKVIVALYKEDAPIDCFINFWNKLNQNPSNKAVNRLYEFIERHNITILPDGDLLLYRVVKRTEEPGVFVDLYTGTMKQAIGDTVKMLRNKVVDDNLINCGPGLHTSNFNYTKYYGNAYSGQDAVINVSVNPANIVSIPIDQNCAKLRVCEFTILEENTALTEIRQTYYNNQLKLESSYEDAEYDEDYLEDDYWDDELEDPDEDY
jgi:hypothetical protein